MIFIKHVISIAFSQVPNGPIIYYLANSLRFSQFFACLRLKIFCDVSESYMLHAYPVDIFLI
jgi:hypothetical protein